MCLRGTRECPETQHDPFRLTRLNFIFKVPRMLTFLEYIFIPALLYDHIIIPRLVNYFIQFDIFSPPHLRKELYNFNMYAMSISVNFLPVL